MIWLAAGGVLSPTIFNIVMARVSSATPRSIPKISCTNYAHDICISAPTAKPPPPRVAAQYALNAVSTSLDEARFEVGKENASLRSALQEETCKFYS